MSVPFFFAFESNRGSRKPTISFHSQKRLSAFELNSKRSVYHKFELYPVSPLVAFRIALIWFECCYSFGIFGKVLVIRSQVTTETLPHQNSRNDNIPLSYIYTSFLMSLCCLYRPKQPNVHILLRNTTILDDCMKTEGKMQTEQIKQGLCRIFWTFAYFNSKTDHEIELGLEGMKKI